MAEIDDGGRARWRLPAAVIGVPVLTVAGAVLVFGALTGTGASTWQAGLAGVGLGMGGLVAGLWVVRAVRRAEGERRQRGLRAAAATWAQQNGWQVRQGQECTEEAFPRACGPRRWSRCSATWSCRAGCTAGTCGSSPGRCSTGIRVCPLRRGDGGNWSASAGVTDTATGRIANRPGAV